MSAWKRRWVGRPCSASNGSCRATTNPAWPSNACWRARPKCWATQGRRPKHFFCAASRSTSCSLTPRAGKRTRSSSAHGAFTTAAGSRWGQPRWPSPREPTVPWKSGGRDDQAAAQRWIMATVETGVRIAKLALVVNALLAIGKIATGVLGNSYVLIADGIESTADIFSSVVVWGGLRVSVLPADENHPFGHGKAEPVAGIIVSMILLAAAVLIAVQSVHEILTP